MTDERGGTSTREQQTPAGHNPLVPFPGGLRVWEHRPAGINRTDPSTRCWGLAATPAQTSKGAKLFTGVENQVSSPFCSYSPGWVGKANEVIKARLKEPRCSHVENSAPAAAHKQQESTERGRAGAVTPRGPRRCFSSHLVRVLLFPELLMATCDFTSLRNK